MQQAAGPLRLNNRKKGQVGNPNGIGGFKPGVSGNPSGVSRMYALSELRDMMRSYTRPAVATILGIMCDKNQSGQVRLAAAMYICDQGWGKPTQVHSNPDGSPLDFTGKSDAELIAELERVRAIESSAIDITPAGGSAVVSDETGARVRSSRRKK